MTYTWQEIADVAITTEEALDIIRRHADHITVVVVDFMADLTTTIALHDDLSTTAVDIQFTLDAVLESASDSND